MAVLKIPDGSGGYITVRAPSGREIELQNSNGYVQWRYVGDESWTNLITLTEIKGDKGDKGENGDPGIGLPLGGLPGQVPVRTDGPDYETVWGDAADPNAIISSDESINDWVTVTPEQFESMKINNEIEEGRMYSVPGDAITASTSTPVGGVIIWFGLPTKIPANYLILIGKVGSLQMVSKTTYPTLFDRYGYTFGGSGDNFALPPLGGRVVVGLDSAQTEFDTLGETGGAKTHTLTIAQMPYHRHDRIMPMENSDWVLGDTAGLGGTASSPNISRFNNDALEQPGTRSLWGTNNTGGGQAHNNLPPYIVGYYIIKVREEAYTEDLYKLDSVVSDLVKNSSIYDVGVNSNGEYIRLNNGIMICYGKKTYVDQVCTADYWSFSNRTPENLSCDFPVNFITEPTVCEITYRCTVGGAVGLYRTSNATASNSGTVGITIAKASTANRDIILNYIAIGKWK